MLSYEESLKILRETNALLEGHFVLSSGLHSEKYVQCAQLLSKPDKASLICQSLAQKINKEFKNIDLILSPAIGGIVIGYEIGRLLNKETIFSERMDNHFILRRGFQILNKDGLRNSKEFVNHKILDCIGDLFTSGYRIIGSVKCSKGGHYSTNQLLRKVFSDNSNFSIIEIQEKNLPHTLINRSLLRSIA